MPKGYSRTQIRLHWAIFALVALQFLLNGPISQAWESMRKGIEPAFSPLILAHVAGGVLIALLVLWRIALRKRRGAPELPGEEPEILKKAALVSHMSLNLLLLLLVLSGGMAFFAGIGAAAETHEVLKALLMILVGLHVAAALYHQFVLKTNLLDRMRTPDTE